MSKKVADIIVETLQNAGVRHCYGIVGDTLNLIARSLERSEIEWVSVRHEEAGAFAAQAEAQVTGRKLGMQMRGSTPDELQARLKGDIVKWSDLIEKAHIPKHD